MVKEIELRNRVKCGREIDVSEGARPKCEDRNRKESRFVEISEGLPCSTLYFLEKTRTSTRRKNSRPACSERWFLQGEGKPLLTKVGRAVSATSQFVGKCHRFSSGHINGKYQRRRRWESIWNRDVIICVNLTFRAERSILSCLSREIGIAK
jgi:hypothetical protein